MGGMVAILHFFTKYAILIYSLLILGLVFSVRSIVLARLEMGKSLYGLEREAAHRHTNHAVTAFSIVMLLIIAELVLTVFLAPILPAISWLATPTMNPLITPTNPLPPELLATLRFITPAPTLTAQAIGCIPGQIMITSPKPGEVIKDHVILVGTANIPNFGFYKYEFSPLGTDVWSTIQANREVKQDAELGRWDTSEVVSGDYNLRLVVTDNEGIELPPCIVPVRVETF